MKYKVGDKVKVRSDLKTCEQYGSNIATKSMEALAGKTVTISKVGFAAYKISEADCYWTDEMFEPVQEMSAEELARILALECEAHPGCYKCPIRKLDNRAGCVAIIHYHYKEVIEIAKQWKADHEKKPMETEFGWYMLVVEEKTHIVKCEKPLKIRADRTTDEQKEDLLREWCSEHDGKYYVTTERRCVVKE